MKILGLLLAIAGGLFAQDHYKATAATTALTLQQPSSNARQITFGDAQIAGASVYCAAAQTATLSWNGTVTSATAGTELKLPGTQQPSGMTVWTATNQSSPGTSGEGMHVPAGSTFNIDLSWFRFGTQGTSSNITITTTGTCTITFNYSAGK